MSKGNLAAPQTTNSTLQNLEKASKHLCELNKMSTGHPFLFPFVIIPDDPQVPTSTPFHVKLDSGCELNWISARVLKRARIEGRQMKLERAKGWLGFNGERDFVVPKATIILTWYSVNAAYTHRHEFLVHEDVPFDVVLGSEFIIEEGWKKSFNDPVLALRHSDLTDEQLDRIHQKTREDKEQSEAQIQAERAMRARDRQRRRMLNVSRTGTPRSNHALSRKSSMGAIPYASSSATSSLPFQTRQSTDTTDVEPALAQGSDVSTTTHLEAVETTNSLEQITASTSRTDSIIEPGANNTV
ncbi:hypothetical protein F53441_12983 [Fusarium austroafricanum]|uniref:Uncharacterized protein n=1 Tax=Fusarium austroafricanum TaxID=2364996 RepID=A0A8H4JVJ6_9HYPO|nr:hypothetical protein F53441_12983 [Fusarium austroafricanum]